MTPKRLQIIALPGVPEVEPGDDLARIVSNTCRCPGSRAETPMFTKTTMPNAKQQKALNLLQTISP